MMVIVYLYAVGITMVITMVITKMEGEYPMMIQHQEWNNVVYVVFDRCMYVVNNDEHEKAISASFSLQLGFSEDLNPPFLVSPF